MNADAVTVHNPDDLKSVSLRAVARAPHASISSASIRRALRVGPHLGEARLAAVRKTILNAMVQQATLDDDALHEQLLDPSFHTLWFPASKLSRHSLQKISRRCPRIRSLDLSECFLVDDETVKEILLALPYISSLRVEGCRKLSDAAVPHLLAHGASLEIIDIGGCYNISTEALDRLLTRFPNAARIRGLHISGCNLSTSGMERIATHYPSLEELSLGYSTASAEHISALLSSKPRLRKLRLHWSLNVTDNLLLHIAGACPHLCELDLCGVRGLTSDAVFSFAMQAYPPAQEGGPIRLQRLNMRFTSLNPETAAMIEQQCPDLQVIQKQQYR